MDAKQNFKIQSRRSLENELSHYFQSSMDQLHEFWKEFGIDREQITNRSNTVLMHVRNLLDDLVKEEEELMTNIKKNVNKYEKELKMLYSELGEKSYEPYDHMPLLQRDKYLYSQVECLKNRKLQRIENYKRLQKIESRLCTELGTSQNSKTVSDVPKLRDLEELENYVFKLTDLRDNRYHKYCQTKHQLTTILEETQIAPEIPFIKDIISENNEALLLSQEKLDQVTEALEKAQKLKNEMVEEMQILIKKLNEIWDVIGVDPDTKSEFQKQHAETRRSTILAMKQEIKRCEEVKQQLIIQDITQLREELLLLWNKCYVSAKERRQFEPFYHETYTEEFLKLYKTEVDRLKEYHKNTEKIFEKINQRHELWNKMLDFERKVQNPNRFLNRGGKLLQEERERKKLLKDLPHLEEIILQDIEKYEERSAAPLLVNGVNFSEYIKQQWENHQKEKENERLVRQKERAVPSTPCKRSSISKIGSASAPSKICSNRAYPLNKRDATPNQPPPVKRCMTSVKKETVFSMQTRSTKHNLLTQKNYNEGVKSPPSDTTLYADFEKELNRKSRDRLRSTITPKHKVLGNRINKRSSPRKNRIQHLSNSGGKSKSKNFTSAIKQSATKTPTKAPSRGKWGLPFLV